METFAAIAGAITSTIGSPCRDSPEGRVAGGSINVCYRWRSDSGPLFVKVAALEALPMLVAEAAGLAALARANAVRVPRVRAVGPAAQSAFLALEWLTAGRADTACERLLGEQLAALHRVTADRFGWSLDNTIGSTPQANTPCADWTEFFRERRLKPQLALAAANGYLELEPWAERLLESVPQLLAGHRPQASLLHGDLWAGNWLALATGEPALFDPAVYYGDRETDLAMTRLFGGFGAAFYQAYEAAAPLPGGAALRCELYNLYHVLNHANLFGGGYAGQARAMMQRLLAQLRP
jgi:protein-ribulosamine 3-kinase